MSHTFTGSAKLIALSTINIIGCILFEAGEPKCKISLKYIVTLLGNELIVIKRHCLLVLLSAAWK